jgi:hypothetical protein
MLRRILSIASAVLVLALLPAGGPSIGIFRGNGSTADVATGAVITVGAGGAGGPGGLTPGIGLAGSGATGLAQQIV